MSAAPLVFITGASSGIGQALAARYAQLGWRLAIVARRRELLTAWAAAEGLDDTRCRSYAADVSVPDSIIDAGRRCLEELGVPDVVIACAGVSIGIDTAERADLDVMAETFALNNTGMAATFHPFMAPMRARRAGTLVGIASVAAIRGLPGHGAYCASKAAVVAYCESLRVECRRHGVRVVTLLPGWIATPLTSVNRYPMPFMLQADAFAVRAVRAISAGVSYRVIPWQMGLVSKLLRLLPNRLFDRLFANRGRKPRRTGAGVGTGPGA
jgi:short-subunit dehydrogenase